MYNSFPIHSEEKKLKQVLEDKYLIPAYQRPYEWDERNIDDFLDSVLGGYKKKFNEDGYDMVFFGTIQLDKNEEKDCWDIVDGQQRLTTFLLLISILREKSGKDSKDYYESINLTRLKDNLDWSASKKMEEITHDSKYVVNRQILSDKLNKLMIVADEGDTLYSNLESYILEKVYFVCLYTQNMPLTDVVGVFNTINTTGLDLNVSDIFKFRYFDYLNSIKKTDDWMDQINECYERIERNNENRDKPWQSRIEMSWILDIYKHILCAYCDEIGMSDASKSTPQFFDDLLHNDKYDNKRKMCARMLQYDTFSKLVDIFLDFYRWYELNEETNITMEYFSVLLIYETRYGKFWTIPFVVAFFELLEKEDWKKDKETIYRIALRVNADFLRLCVMYSVVYAKIVYEAQSFVYETIFPFIRDKNYEEINRRISSLINETGYKGEFEEILRNNLFSNGRRVRLICMISALISEISNGTPIKEIKSKLFDWSDDDHRFDVEHIFARKSFDGMDSKSIETLNGIGNLVVLERSINRRIKDIDPKDKSEEYKKSRYKIVEELRTTKAYELSSINAGNIDAIKSRQGIEVSRIKDFMGIS